MNATIRAALILSLALGLSGGCATSTDAGASGNDEPTTVRSVSQSCGPPGIKDGLRIYTETQPYALVRATISDVGPAEVVGKSRQIATPLTLRDVESISGRFDGDKAYIEGGTVGEYTTVVEPSPTFAAGETYVLGTLTVPEAGPLPQLSAPLVFDAFPIIGERVFFGGPCWTPTSEDDVVPGEAQLRSYVPGQPPTVATEQGSFLPLSVVRNIAG